MVQTLQVPNTRAVKIIGEQSTGAETAALVDASGHLQVDVISGTVADSTAAGLLTTIDADTGAIKTAVEKLATETTVGAGMKVEQGYTFLHLAAAGQVKATAGFIHTLSINTAGTATVVTLYDNPAAAGNVIGIYTVAVGSISPFCAVLDVACPNGIYVDMTVAVDVTAAYR